MGGVNSKVECDLFQSQDSGSIPTTPLQFNIREVSQETAKTWVEKWHYSRRIPTGKNFCLGLFADTDLYAVIVLGIGVNPYQSEFLSAQRVIEIKRMCRSEPRIEQYPLSRFISVALKMAMSFWPYDCVVAFADPQHGHEGTVYKASGFTLHGMTNSEWHVEDSDGNVRHRRFAFRHARRNGIPIAQSREALNLKRVCTAPKYRWIRRVKPKAAIPSRVSRASVQECLEM